MSDAAYERLHQLLALAKRRGDFITVRFVLHRLKTVTRDPIPLIQRR